jgi:SAM-dependent methyltransferase
VGRDVADDERALADYFDGWYADMVDLRSSTRCGCPQGTRCWTSPAAAAVHQATEHARRLGREAEFHVGGLGRTGLDEASVDAVLCVDAIQFADEPAAAYAELRRFLPAGGRVALTAGRRSTGTTSACRSGCGRWTWRQG